MNSYIINKQGLRVVLMLMIMGCFSCSKFLDVSPTTQVSDATLWESTANADLFLNTIYAGVPGPFQTDDPWENFSDNAMNGVSGRFSRVVYGNSVYTPSNAPSQWGHYDNIRKSNLFIQKVTASKLSDEWKKQRLGEARFLRAYYYMLLWTVYGGVPVITDVLNQGEQGAEIFRPRNTSEETFKFITDECAAIAGDLPVTSDAGRATRGAVLALQGWCELFEASPLKNAGNDKAKWAKAAATNKKVLDLKAYTLFPDYNTMFYEGNNNNVEVIFDKQYLGGTALGNYRVGHHGPTFVDGVMRGYGLTIPTQELVDDYFMENGLPITDPQSGYDDQNPYANREKRFYQSIVYDGATWLGATMVMKQGVNSRNATDLSDADESTNTGYYWRKGFDPKYATIQNGQNSANFIIFRLGEVLLSFAEAQNEAAGPDDDVYDAVNKVRARSSLPDLKKGLTQGEMRIAIRQERRIELAGEEKRWYDLLRWKIAEDKLNKPLHAIKIDKVGNKWVYTAVPAAGGGRTFYANKNYLLPIPQAAMDRNNKLVQNPNY